VNQLSDFTILNKDLEKNTLYLKVSPGQTLITIDSEDKKAIFTIESNALIQSRLSEFCPQIEEFLESTKDQFKIKMVGSKVCTDELAGVFKQFDCEVQKVVIRENGFEAIYYKDKDLVRINKDIIAASKIKVLVVDDSNTIRTLIGKILAPQEDIHIIGSIGDPLEVESFIQKERPDVITLDIHMPNLNGVELLKEIFPKYGIPTIMISSISMEEGQFVLEALENGAYDYIQKPSMGELATVAPQIVEKIRLASQTNIRKEKVVNTTKVSNTFSNIEDSLILIGSSTGGTDALRRVLTRLPANIPPILIVQHIPPVFSRAFAERLNNLCPFEVKEAEHLDEVVSNRVLIAPGGMHMRLRKVSGVYKVALDEEEAINRFRPSVDALFDSAQKNLAKQTVAVMLTGMGKDGAHGMKKLNELGVKTIAQSEETCVVFGMPREAIKLGGVDQTVDLEKIAEKIIELCSD
jgi:two-component system chemotaxis response regulator CheB